MERPFEDLQLRQLEDRLRPWRHLPRDRPHRGWIRATRETLGMTRAQLARRLGVTPQAVAALERREVLGTATLAALEKAAGALGCDLLYAAVPREPLRDMIEQQALRRAAADVERVSHTMRLEGQEVSPEETRRLVRESVEGFLRGRRRALWDPPAAE